jgi:hypothetical protein
MLIQPARTRRIRPVSFPRSILARCFPLRALTRPILGPPPAGGLYFFCHYVSDMRDGSAYGWHGAEGHFFFRKLLDFKISEARPPVLGAPGCGGAGLQTDRALHQLHKVRPPAQDGRTPLASQNQLRAGRCWLPERRICARESQYIHPYSLHRTRFMVMVHIGGENAQVDRCCLCLGDRNICAGHVARSGSSAGHHDHASPRRMRRGYAHG